MASVTNIQNSVATMIAHGEENNVFHRYLDNTSPTGRTIYMKDKEIINFGSCSYLGLEVDERIKAAAIEAIQSFGVHFSASRTFLCLPQYADLEELLTKIYSGHVQLAPTTTLGHVATLPTIIAPEDAVIFDMQVHHSVQTTLHQIRTQGSHVEVLRHNDINRLEKRIQKLRGTHKKIWYLADGVYSMYGDLAPIKELNELKHRYPQLHLYIDDAHGVSWTGYCGKGYVLKQLPDRERTFVAVSLGKAFGVGGAAIIFPDAETKLKVKNCGGPMLFSGPLQPSLLGAAVASAKIHLTDEIHLLQSSLNDRVKYCINLMKQNGIPVFADNDVPIRFVAMGLPRVAFNMLNRLENEGFYLNAAVYPAVSMRRSGLRLALNCHQTLDDIKRLVDAITHHYPLVLKEENSSLEDIYRDFNIEMHETKTQTPKLAVKSRAGLKLEVANSIKDLRAEEWDSLLGSRGSFTAKGLEFLEEAFSNHSQPEENWNFRYYTIRDDQDKPLLMTFFTDAIWKDDILSPANVSNSIEKTRQSDPYFLTSRSLAMGSLLTEGNHLYLDRNSEWKEALKMLIQQLTIDQKNNDATNLVLRDLPENDHEMDHFLLEQGFSKFPMPSSMQISVDWSEETEYLAKLSHRSRKLIRREVLAKRDNFHTVIYNKNGNLPSKRLLEKFYQLYKNVKDKNLGLNTFDLPKNIFEKMLSYPDWELSAVFLKQNEDNPIAFSADFVGNSHYCPMVIGLDYNYVYQHGIYRQCLMRAINRAAELNAKMVYLGMGAECEKSRFGALSSKHCIYIQSKNLENSELLGQITLGLTDSIEMH